MSDREGLSVKKVIVLGGAGAMGQVIVRDLAASPAVDKVVVADFNTDKANELKAAIKSDKIAVAFADIKDHKKMVDVFAGSGPKSESISIIGGARGYHFVLEPQHSGSIILVARSPPVACERRGGVV